MFQTLVGALSNSGGTGLNLCVGAACKYLLVVVMHAGMGSCLPGRDMACRAVKSAVRVWPGSIQAISGWRLTLYLHTLNHVVWTVSLVVDACVHHGCCKCSLAPPGCLRQLRLGDVMLHHPVCILLALYNISAVHRPLTFCMFCGVIPNCPVAVDPCSIAPPPTSE